jgi:hypothetical protein
MPVDDTNGQVTTGFDASHLWLCDAIGQFSSRYYLGFLDNTLGHRLADLGHVPADVATEGWGRTDVGNVIECQVELQSVAMLRSRNQAPPTGTTSLTARSMLRDRPNERLRASPEAKITRFDLNLGIARPENFMIEAAATNQFIPIAYRLR